MKNLSITKSDLDAAASVEKDVIDFKAEIKSALLNDKEFVNYTKNSLLSSFVDQAHDYYLSNRSDKQLAEFYSDKYIWNIVSQLCEHHQTVFKTETYNDLLHLNEIAETLFHIDGPVSAKKSVEEFPILTVLHNISDEDEVRKSVSDELSELNIKYVLSDKFTDILAQVLLSLRADILSELLHDTNYAVNISGAVITVTTL